MQCPSDSSTPPVRAVQDPALEARVVRRLAMRYVGGASVAEDRPAYVRAASGLAWIGDRLAVIQDDASFLALLDPATGMAEAHPLPTGVNGIRQFDDSRGNKAEKLDLEALTLVPASHGLSLAAFGSGSLPPRETVVLIAFEDVPSPRIVVHAAHAFYAQLRELRQFAGSEMNIEGALHINESIALFGRGNGAAVGELRPINASCEVRWIDLMAHLEQPARVRPPIPKQITAYDLGTIGQVPLGFTDVAQGRNGMVMFGAAAESSPDATRDGEVVGSAIGVIETEAKAARWTALVDESGRHFTGKVEGLAMHRSDDYRAYAVVDSDDYSRASDLLDLELRGPWWG